MSLIVFMAVD